MESSSYHIGRRVEGSEGIGSANPQGNRVLAAQDFEEVVLSPACLQAFALNSHFQAGSLLQVSCCSRLWEICLSVAMFCALWSKRIRLWSSALVLPEGYLQAPVQRVLNAPVGPRRTQQLLSRPCEAAAVVLGLHCCARLRLTVPHHLDHGPQPGPVPLTGVCMD